MNYHGERGAYIGHSDNIEAATVPHSRSLRFIIISTFFLFLPIVHLRRIENARITDSVERVAIKQLRQWFEESWNESIVPVRLWCILVHDPPQLMPMDVGYGHFIDKCWFFGDTNYRYKPFPQKRSTDGSIYLFCIRVLQHHHDPSAEDQR